MNPTRVILNAYFERLCDLLEEAKPRTHERLEELLNNEINEKNYPIPEPEKFIAYLEAAAAFYDERLESYNPIGIQWTMPTPTTEEAFQIESILDWYDSRPEFDTLCRAARRKAKRLEPDSKNADRLLQKLANELINQCGAYPNKTIIQTYQTHPQLNHLPDYIVSCLIEQIISEPPA